jgi:hypothetical protein
MPGIYPENWYKVAGTNQDFQKTICYLKKHFDVVAVLNFYIEEMPKMKKYSCFFIIKLCRLESKSRRFDDHQQQVKFLMNKNFFFEAFFRYSPSCQKKIFFCTLCEKPLETIYSI